MTVRTDPRRPSVPSPAIDPADALVLAPGELTTGRARSAPLRREGPAKLTGEA
jgi:hypothetical protein